MTLRRPWSRFDGLQATDYLEGLPTLPSESPCMLPLDELRSHHCRWPIGDVSIGNERGAYLFCGEPVEERSGRVCSYCREHARLAYRTIQLGAEVIEGASAGF